MDSPFINLDKVNVRYIVNDVAPCVEFYSKILGFTIEMNPSSGFAKLTRGNLALFLNEPGAGGAGRSMPDGTVPSAGGWNRIQLQTREIQSTIENLKEKAVRFRNELIIAPAGKQILILDPSGNLIELFEPSK